MTITITDFSIPEFIGGEEPPPKLVGVFDVTVDEKTHAGLKLWRDILGFRVTREDGSGFLDSRRQEVRQAAIAEYLKRTT